MLFSYLGESFVQSRIVSFYGFVSNVLYASARNFRPNHLRANLGFQLVLDFVFRSLFAKMRLVQNCLEQGRSFAALCLNKAKVVVKKILVRTSHHIGTPRIQLFLGVILRSMTRLVQSLKHFVADFNIQLWNRFFHRTL